MSSSVRNSLLLFVYFLPPFVFILTVLYLFFLHLVLLQGARHVQVILCNDFRSVIRVQCCNRDDALRHPQPSVLPSVRPPVRPLPMHRALGNGDNSVHYILISSDRQTVIYSAWQLCLPLNPIVGLHTFDERHSHTVDIGPAQFNRITFQFTLYALSQRSSVGCLRANGPTRMHSGVTILTQSLHFSS